MQRRTFVTTLVVLVAGFLVCASLASAAYRGGTAPVATQQGKTVTVLSLWGGTEKEAF